MKKIIIPIVTLVLVMGIPACENEPCGLHKPYFTINDIRLENIKSDLQKRVVLSPNDEVEVKNFYLACHYNVTYYASTYSKKKFLATPSVYADCPGPGGRGSKVGIDTIYIISKKALTPDYNDNDTINNAILIYDGTPKLNPLADYIELNDTAVLRKYVEFTLGVEPKNKTVAHSFTVIIKLDDGKVHTSTTPSVYFK